jgi:hypothetical protein
MNEENQFELVSCVQELECELTYMGDANVHLSTDVQLNVPAIGVKLAREIRFSHGFV